jgi:DNA invertase Pin-like site-specific DNA recombinase
MEQTMQTQTNNIQPPVIPPLLRYCLYARKSTEQDELQALSIDSQIKEMLSIAEREKLDVVEIRKESHSAKAVGQRSVFNQILKDIRAEKFNAILTWAPDRLSRNAGDLGSLVDLMDQKILHGIRTYSQKFSNSPNEKFLLMILCSQAKLENDNKSLNVKRGLKARAEMGLWLSTAPTGYLNEKRTDRKGYVIIDPPRAPIVKKMFEKVAYEQWTGRKLYQWLKSINFKTRTGKNLSLSNIYLILRNTFYYGTFEYPRGSGNWYAGKHKPLMSKELFDKVQERLKRDRIARSESKEFAFTKLMKCGLCGSGITADEKFKKLKDGSVNRYVYYGCSKNKDHYCKCGYLREKDLISQLLNIVDKVNLDKIGMKEIIEKEVERYYKFRHAVLGISKNEKAKQKEIDTRNYAKYILKEGSIFEKRELLSCLKSKLILKNKKIYLEK